MASELSAPRRCQPVEAVGASGCCDHQLDKVSRERLLSMVKLDSYILFDVCKSVV